MGSRTASTLAPKIATLSYREVTSLSTDPSRNSIDQCVLPSVQLGQTFVGIRRSIPASSDLLEKKLVDFS